MMRTAFLIDGFNLYHSVKDVIADGLGTPRLKWLDIPALCAGIVRDCPEIPKTGTLASVHYFTALAKHMEAHSPGIVKRQVCFACPYKRQNNVLKDEADVTFRIRAHRYGKHLLPNPVTTSANAQLHCPTEWWI